MSNDSGRNTFITRFFCKECGRQLKISYEGNDGEKQQFGDDIPTGGYAVNSKAFVYPCICQKQTISNIFDKMINDKLKNISISKT